MLGASVSACQNHREARRPPAPLAPTGAAVGNSPLRNPFFLSESDTRSSTKHQAHNSKHQTITCVISHGARGCGFMMLLGYQIFVFYDAAYFWAKRQTQHWQFLILLACINAFHVHYTKNASEVNRCTAS